LPRENGLNARRRRKFIPATNSNRGLEACENLLSREFQAGAKRASDVARLRTLGGWMRLAAPPDLFDRALSRGPPEREPKRELLGQRMPNLFSKP
jgi:transposase InsO family protein